MLADLKDLTKQAINNPSGRGGRRPGAGRPRKNPDAGAAAPAPKPVKPARPRIEVRDVDELLADDPPPPLVPEQLFPQPTYGDSDPMSEMSGINLTLPLNPAELFAGAKARKEAAHAAKAELDFRIKNGQYLPRDAVRAAIATTFQSVSQSMRSIPDALERKMGLSPEVAEQVSILIDDVMGDLASELEQVHAKTYEVSGSD